MKALHLLIIALVSCAATAFSPLAACAESSMLIFERTPIRVDAITAEGAVPAHEPFMLDVELLPESTLQQETLHSLTTLDDTTGVMIALDSPAMTSIPPYAVFMPVDILFVAENGLVLQIAPNITLSEMSQSLDTISPIKALLFLKAGQAEARGLRPKHDMIAAKIFTTAPTVQE